MEIAKKFPTKLCVTPGIIDECVMNVFKPVCTNYAAHNNDIVVEVCYASGYPYGAACPAWIAKLKGFAQPPPHGCKSWYHVVRPLNLAEAFDWTLNNGTAYGATLRLTRLSQDKVEQTTNNVRTLQSARVLLLVDGVQMDEPLTQEQKRRKSCE